MILVEVSPLYGENHHVLMNKYYSKSEYSGKELILLM